jgi:hypothetical protein
MSKKTNIGNLIFEIGPAFRGLWKSVLYISGEKEECWSVTYVLNGEMVETAYLSTPEAALRVALKELQP